MFIGSMSGAIVNLPQRQTPYNVSKAAVRHLVVSLAVEWATEGIRVNCISPGIYDYAFVSFSNLSLCEMWECDMNRTIEIMEKDPKIYEQWVGGIPQGKMGMPIDLAGPVVFLLSDSAGYVTGADLRVDGGFTLF